MVQDFWILDYPVVPAKKMKIKFIHCADLHLDSPFQGLTTKDPSLAVRFKHATNEAFVKIIDLCLAENIDFLTIGGDTFDGADRSLCAQILLRDQFDRLHKAKIPVILVAGNHDPLSDWLTEIRFPKNVHLLAGDEVETVPIEKDGSVVCTIYGISYKVRDVKGNLSLKFQAKENDVFSIGLLHANVGARKEHAPYSPCTINDLRAGNMDMWLLGHIHTPEVISETPFILYPGNIQGRHINEDGPRGCYLIRVDSDYKISHEFKPVQNILWKQEDINIKEKLTIEGSRFEVVGIVANQGERNHDFAAYMPIDELREITSDFDTVSVIEVKITPGEDPENTANEIPAVNISPPISSTKIAYIGPSIEAPRKNNPSLSNNIFKANFMPLFSRPSFCSAKILAGKGFLTKFSSPSA